LLRVDSEHTFSTEALPARTGIGGSPAPTTGTASSARRVAGCALGLSLPGWSEGLGGGGQACRPLDSGRDPPCRSCDCRGVGVARGVRPPRRGPSRRGANARARVVVQPAPPLLVRRAGGWAGWSCHPLIQDPPLWGASESSVFRYPTPSAHARFAHPRDSRWGIEAPSKAGARGAGQRSSNGGGRPIPQGGNPRG
jgi:hypothetical protein